MRILVLSTYYPRPANEQFAPYNRHQIRELAREHEVRVVAPIPWTMRLKEFKGFPLRPTPYVNCDGLQVDHPLFLFPPKVLSHWYGNFYWASVAATIHQTIHEFRPDVIYSSWAHPDGWGAVRLAKKYGIPVIIKVLGSDVLVITRNPRRRKRVAQALREADGVVAVSQHLAEHVAQLGVHPDRIHVVHEGIDHNLFCPGDAREASHRLGLSPFAGPRLLFVGNLLLSKGAGVLLDACAILRRGGLDFRCHFVGRGKDANRLKRMACTRGLCDAAGSAGVVDFPGSCPQSQLPDWYRACNLMVLPSFSEGIPNVLREAMMCGTAFVATRVGGIPEITRPEVGILVEAGDPQQLAAAIFDALAKGLRADHATAHTLNITWQESAKQWGDIARSLLSQRKSIPVDGSMRTQVVIGA